MAKKNKDCFVSCMPLLLVCHPADCASPIQSLWRRFLGSYFQSVVYPLDSYAYIDAKAQQSNNAPNPRPSQDSHYPNVSEHPSTNRSALEPIGSIRLQIHIKHVLSTENCSTFSNSRNLLILIQPADMRSLTKPHQTAPQKFA